MKRAAKDQSDASGKRVSSAAEGGETGTVFNSGKDKERPSKQTRRQSSDQILDNLGAGGSLTMGRDAESLQYLEQPKKRTCQQPSAKGHEEDRQGSAAGAPLAPDDTELSKSLTEVTASSPSAATAFPAQLLCILQRSIAPEALWFLEGGEAIGIHSKLIDKVLNDHLRGMKFNSLVRNLNRWGFRRISHDSLKDDERGYHHLLFQKDKPHLVHRMKKDSNAKEVVRQLDLEEGKPEAASDGRGKVNARKRVAAESKSEAHPPPMSLVAQQSTLAQTPLQQLQGAAGMQGYYPALYGGPAHQQQLAWQGLQQNLEWQRQQAAFAQMGAVQRSMWGHGLGNWNQQQQQSLPLTVPMAGSLPQQHFQTMSFLDVARDTTPAGANMGAAAPSATEAKEDVDQLEDPNVESNRRWPSL